MYDLERLVLVLAFTGSASALAYLLRTLDGLGSLAAFIIATVVTYVPPSGLRWLVALGFFFTTSSLFTRTNRSKKTALDLTTQSAMRGWPNVVANGLMPALFALAYGWTGSAVFTAGFLGSLSTGTADTWATELGIAYGGTPRLITHPNERVSVGRSGGISLHGEIAAMIGSSLTALVGLWIGLTPINPLTVGLIAFSGFVASQFDSLLGATVQGRYECTVCGLTCETKSHCNQPAIIVGGRSGVNNDVVNLLASIAGAVLPMLFLT